jgi:hypothetical protein
MKCLAVNVIEDGFILVEPLFLLLLEKKPPIHDDHRGLASLAQKPTDLFIHEFPPLGESFYT